MPRQDIEIAAVASSNNSNGETQAPQTEVPANPQEQQQNNNDLQTSAAEKMLEELIYSVASFHAVFTPVAMTMILSALAVVYINTDETRENGEAAYSQSYEVFKLEEDNTSQNLGASLANTFIIVSAICVATFGVVILYKYRCLKILYGYLIVATAMLLGYFTGVMWNIAIDIYGWDVDKLSFYYILYNFAAVGTAATFYGRGFPLWIKQGYLIATSVVLAWQLSYFNEWTAWTLLVMLALYDLFAVLSPCGPLKALVNQMSKSDAPELPSLLYEAPLPKGVRRPKGRKKQNQQPGPQQQQQEPQSEPTQQAETDPETDRSIRRERLPDDEDIGESSQSSAPPDISVQFQHANSTPEPMSPFISPCASMEDEQDVEISIPPPPGVGAEREGSQESIEMTLPSQVPEPPSAVQTVQQSSRNSQSGDIDSSPTGKVALAVAKLYKLRVIDNDGVLTKRGERNEGRRVYSPEEIKSIKWTSKQLRTEVNAVFPALGGSIESADPRKRGEGRQYIVKSRSGEVLRTFMVNQKGELFQVVIRKAVEDDPKNNTIKLGLVSCSVACWYDGGLGYNTATSSYPHLHYTATTGRFHFLLYSCVEGSSL
jgi:hypothetical protein